MIANTLIHREFTSSYTAKFVIEKDRMYTENANRSSGDGIITPDNMEPNPKNPISSNLIFTAASTIKYDRPRLRICYKTISLPNIKKCQTLSSCHWNPYQNDHDNISQTDPDMSILSIFLPYPQSGHKIK